MKFIVLFCLYREISVKFGFLFLCYSVCVLVFVFAFYMVFEYFTVL